MSGSRSQLPLCTEADTDATNCRINPYVKFIPSLAMSIIFMVLFLGSAFWYLWQIYGRKPRPYRFKWMLVFVFCGFFEVVGWGGRVWSHFDIESSGYIMQIVCLVISPTLISAGLYLLLGILIERIAPQHSRLSGKAFKIWFICADVASLGVQAAGGGIAATAELDSDVDTGGRIMLAGICVQLVIMIVFSVYGLVWYRRSASEIQSTNGRGKGVQLVLCGMALSSFMIIVRGFFRCAELGDGFQGSIATNEMLFLLDAIPVVIAMLALNIFSPPKYLANLADPITGSDKYRMGAVAAHGDEGSYKSVTEGKFGA